MMNDRVLNIVHEQARAYYEGRASSVEAFAAIDNLSQSAFNWYPGVKLDTRELFDNLVDSFISEDVDEHRHETYESRQLRRVRDHGTEDGFYRLQVQSNGDHTRATKWLNITPAQLDAMIRVFEV